jgi:rhodanese-related sulfurtransferase
MRILLILILGVLLPGIAMAEQVKIDGSKADFMFSQRILFVDVRGNSDWDAGRIAGAEHIDVNKISADSLGDLVEKDDVFIIYGNDPGDKRLTEAVTKAVSSGYTKIHYYPGGFIDWKKRGKPVE